MKILKFIYEKTHHQRAPYYFDYSLIKMVGKPARKWFTNVIAANCPFNCIRILIYRICGFKIGKGTFIGMHCYLDDMCYDILKIGKKCIISYGVYFSCHGKNQEHMPIMIEDGAYIGMRANIISKNVKTESQGVTIGKNAIIGACTLVNRDIPEGATAVGIPCRVLLSKEKICSMQK